MEDEHGHDEHDHDDHHHHTGDYHAYEADLTRHRARKDDFLKSSPASPIPAADREAFAGLPYFEPDPGLRLEGLRLEPYEGSEPTAFAIPTSDGRLRPAHRAGSFRLDLAGHVSTLTAYTLDGGDATSLFVPFLDGTSGHETYGAGRYLDLKPEADGTYVLDFNLAYNPYCVYAESYSCPLTPAENRLPVRIEAGERLPAPT